MKKLNKCDLVELVAENSKLSKKEVRETIDATFDLITKSLIEGQEVNIINFGVFMPRQRKEREGTHPKQHSRIVIKGAKTVSFKLSKNLKSELN